MFGFTLPAARFAVDYFHPVFIGAGRSVVAALIALPLLLFKREPFPNASQLIQLAIAASGVVIAFPNLTALAMQTIPAAQGGVVLAFLPLGTAIVAAIIAKERPSLAFWLSGLFGCVLVVIFSLIRAEGTLHIGDLALFIAVVMTAVGYAMGARLSRDMGGWQVISWALVISLPLTIPATFWSTKDAFLVQSFFAWICFFYMALISQLFAFFLWYRALAIGGIARVSQIMLLLPFVTILAAALVLNEPLDPLTFLFAFLVIMTVGLNRKTSVEMVE